MTDTTVTMVTKDATRGDTLGEADYRDIFTELRQNLSLDKLVTVLGSRYSKAVWSRYERGDYEVTRQMRNELRRGVGMAELPATVTDAVAAHASPDAAVWIVGGDVAEHVILVGGADDLTLHVNGGVAVMTEAPCNYSNDGVDSTEIRLGYVDAQNDARAQIGASSTVLRKRPPLVRPVASQGQEARRVGLGVAWRQVIDAGLDALSAKGE